MGVTIDNLQIEIQSSSTNAAKGITDLSAALEKLKKNGSFKTVSTNLNNLSESLNKLPNVHRASNSLRTLANSIEKLKEVGSVASISNSLKKLPEALKGIEKIDLDRVAPQIQKIVATLSPLSAVKAGGFGSMVNAMRNLGKVTESLDDDTIKAFADKIKLLNAELGPFADKMATVKSAFGAINSQARKAAGGVAKMDDEVNASALNWSNFIHIMQTAAEAIKGIVTRFSDLIAQAIEWDGIAARFGRGFGSQAQENYEWIQRLNEELGINIQEFMKYSSVYSTMLTGFGVNSKDAGKMAMGYMELTYDIWAGYNDVYKKLEDAAEAVKSAIAGEVEPVRRAGFTIVEATLEQTAANHGLEISLANATEAQKSYLRYLTLVDQAYAQGLVGTYAKELNTAEGLTRTLAQQLKSLTQAFGSLFLPILVKVMPWLQAFVELLTEGIQALAAMFGITIQGVDWGDYNSGVSDAVQGTENLGGALENAADAAKELKNATLAFDELNVISPSSASSGAGGSGGGIGGGTGFEDLDIDSLWDESIFKDINSQVDGIKEKLKSWLPIISLIGAGIGAWGMLSLISSAGEAMVKLSELEGKIGLLKKALAGLAILTIEAVLVFMLSDEYLETGNLMSLLGEALVTAAGGFLMYKGFGPKGLILSLGVSMIAQLAAITMNLADGGVEMSDPQLWIQAAFTTALGGVAGGILSYKGLINMSKGKGVGLGLLAGLSLTLASITIGEVSANGGDPANSIWTAVGSIASAAGFGFMVGGGVPGALIGAAVGLVVNVVGAIVGGVSAKAQKSLEDDLKSRFGRITLKNESLAVYINTITAIPRTVKLGDKTYTVDSAINVYVTEVKTLENLEESFYRAAEKLDTMNIKIAVGVDVSFDEYISQVETFLSGAQAYLEQHYLTTSIAIEILQSNSSDSLSSVLSSFYATNSGKLAELGSQLKDAVSDAFVDGEWIPNKLQEALELQKEIQEILDYVSDVEYRAQMENIKLSISGTALTPESFKDVLKGATEAIEERLNALEEVKMSNLQVAIMQYDANIAKGKSEAQAKKIYDKTVADIEKAYQDGKVEVIFGTVDFGLETLKDAFAAELDKAKKEKWFDLDLQLDRVFSMPQAWDYMEDDGSAYLMGGFKTLIDELEGQINTDLSKVSTSTRDNLEGLLESLTPTMADFEKIAKANREAGTTVTESVREGLNDYKELAAISGDTAAINYMIGQGFATDTAFLNTLATAEDAGKQIDASVAEGLLNNLTYVRDKATGVVTGIKNSITGEVIAVTPTLKENLAHMGVDLSKGISEGIKKEEPNLWDSFTTWCGGMLDTVMTYFDINSPSKVMRDKVGKNLSSGIAAGMETNTIKDKLSSMWSSAMDWWGDEKDGLKSYTPSIGNIATKLSSAWTEAKNWWNDKRSSLSYTPTIGKISDKLKTAWTDAKNWWSDKRSSLSYTPSIGSISSKLSSAWTTAKNWWNKSRSSLSYTPSIGSIKDKIVSAWNTAKKWWSSNASLSTKLNVSVPKITVKWDTASAFGKSFKYPTGFSLKFAANGGIFDQGSLIWAGERGPEVMAKAAGGKTGVMNVQQMQDAVYEGVYAAVTAAMRGQGGGSQEVNVYLDGRQITAAVEQRQRERGASLIGDEVYSY